MNAVTSPPSRTARFGLALVVGSILLLATASTTAAQQNWADRLGYGANNKVLILHADDAGMFAGTNTGIQAMLLSGEIQSTSAMPPVRFFGEMVDWHNSQGNRDVGLHLTLNAEWDGYIWGPIYDPPREVRRILRKRFLFWGWRPYFPGGSFWTFLYRGPNTVKKELAAQIDAAVDGLPARNGNPAIAPMNPPPSHLDSHMGSVFVRKSHFKKYLELAKEYHEDPNRPSIPALTFENYDATRECFLKLTAGDPMGRVAKWVTGRLKRAQDEVQPWPFPRLDQYCPIPYGTGLDQTRALLLNFIQNELANGITQILFHPSDEDALLRSSMAPSRADRRVLVDRKIFDRTDPGNVLLPIFSAPDILFTNWRNMTARFNTPDLCVDPLDGQPWTRPSTCP